MASKAPTGGVKANAASEAAVSPMIGTMFVFVIIVMGMSGALVFGVPSITSIQDRATLEDMASQLEQVREEAEKLTVEGAGAGIVLAPSDGYVSLQEGTKMAVTISFDSTAQQQGLALAWGKGGKKKNQVDVNSKQCDVHFQDWSDGDQYVTMVMDKTYCQTPMIWDPADGTSSSSGTTTTQTLGVASVVGATGWTDATAANLGTSDNLYATYATDSPSSTNDLWLALADPTTPSETITGVVVYAEVAVSNANNDGFSLGACLNGGSCHANNDFSSKDGVSSADVTISYDITSERPGGGSWAWTDITGLEPVVRLEQTGGGQNGRDGTWRVDRVWAVVTSSSSSTSTSTTNGNNNGECFDSSATTPVACLQGFKMTDSGAVNRVVELLECSGGGLDANLCPDGNVANTYGLRLDQSLDGDWYFQISNDPRTPSSDTLLAKSYIYEMDQLRWVRDQGLATWLEGGAVFGTRLDTHYVISDPIIDENFIEKLNCAANDATTACQPTYYLRVIRFGGDQASVAVNGGAVDTYLEHQATRATANDGVSIMRFDFDGEGAELWCNALESREPPEGYDYVEHDDYPCDGSDGNGVRSLAYVYDPTCPDVAPSGYNWAAGLSEADRDKTTGCIQYKRDLRRYYSVVFAEVHFDVKLRP